EAPERYLLLARLRATLRRGYRRDRRAAVPRQYHGVRRGEQRDRRERRQGVRRLQAGVHGRHPLRYRRQRLVRLGLGRRRDQRRARPCTKRRTGGVPPYAGGHFQSLLRRDEAQSVVHERQHVDLCAVRERGWGGAELRKIGLSTGTGTGRDQEQADAGVWVRRETGGGAAPVAPQGGEGAPHAVRLLRAGG